MNINIQGRVAKASWEAMNSALLIYVLKEHPSKTVRKIVLYRFLHMRSQASPPVEVAIQRRLVVTFHRCSPGIRRASPGPAVWQPHFICSNLWGLLDISMQLSLMV